MSESGGPKTPRTLRNLLGSCWFVVRAVQDLPGSVGCHCPEASKPHKPGLPNSRPRASPGRLQLEDVATLRLQPARLDLLEPLQRTLVEAEDVGLRGVVICDDGDLVDHHGR